MDEQQMQQLTQQVAQMLQEGADPNKVIDELVKSGMDEQTASQLVDDIMGQLEGGDQSGNQGAGQGEGSSNTANGDPNDLLDQVMQKVGPNILLAIFEAYDNLGAQGQSAKKQQLSEMSTEGEARQGTAQGATEQPGQAVFG